MDERKLYILSAIIRSYIDSAEPIGSRTLQRDFEMKVSPATIRNEMSDLEHLGFLMKAHTSSGRIPSDRAYRWYVDELMARGEIANPMPQLFSKTLLHESNELEHVIDNALHILSETTNLTAIAVLPNMQEDILRYIELIPLGEREVVIVLVFHSKMVKNTVVHLSAPCTKARVQRANEIIKSLLTDKTLSEVDEILHSQEYSVDRTNPTLFTELIPAIAQTIEESLHNDIRFAGLDKVFRLPEQGSMLEAEQMIGILQAKDELQKLLMEEKNRPIEVYIGPESGIPALESNSIVLAPYRAKGRLRGKIGVIGPTRMQYPKVLHDVSLIAKYINSIVDRS